MINTLHGLEIPVLKSIIELLNKRGVGMHRLRDFEWPSILRKLFVTFIIRDAQLNQYITQSV
jgi:hypothetical protein